MVSAERKSVACHQLGCFIFDENSQFAPHMWSWKKKNKEQMHRKKYQVLSMYYHFVLRPELFKVLESLGSSCKKQILETHFRYTEEFSQRLETKNMDFFFFLNKSTFENHYWTALGSQRKKYPPQMVQMKRLYESFISRRAGKERDRHGTWRHSE